MHERPESAAPSPAAAPVRGRDIVRTARGFLGTRFRHQGRVPGRGLDCAGVIVCAAQAAGLMVYDVTGYGRLPDGESLTRHLGMAGCREIAATEARPGDLYLMRFEREPQHLALVTELGILHAYADIGRVVEHRLDEAWRARIVAAFRLPGVT
jgi:cell wall-associated NlpC family hydrolase